MMKKVLGKIFFGLLAFGFVVPLVILFPLFMVLLRRKAWHGPALYLSHLWAFCVFFFMAVPVRATWHQRHARHKPHILVANHFSYLDIPAISVHWWKAKFVGKSSLGQFPLFGYMYKRLHIMVDRANRRSRAESVQGAKEALKAGYSVVLFPEGGIRSKKKPEMVDFKDGAFNIAMELGLPVVPVSMPYNYQVLDDPGKISVTWRPLRVVFHNAVDPAHYVDNGGAQRMKEDVFHILQSSLNSYHESR